MIQDLSGSRCIKGTGEPTLITDSPVTLMNHDPDRSWITDADPDYPKGTQPMTRVDLPVPLMHHDSDRSWVTDSDLNHPKGTQP